MVEKDPLFKSKVRHVGTFDFKETYRILYEWFIDNGYEINETMYKEIIGSGGAKEVSVFWDAKKTISDYFQFFISVWFHPLNMTSIEVEIDGVKQKQNKGDFTIEISCALIKDYKNKWNKNNFYRFLKSSYDRYIIPARTEQYEGMLIGEMDELTAQAKVFLALTGKR
jgi:hypothetical protein